MSVNMIFRVCKQLYISQKILSLGVLLLCIANNPGSASFITEFELQRQMNAASKAAPVTAMPYPLL
jgi:hypothetical protein